MALTLKGLQTERRRLLARIEAARTAKDQLVVLDQMIAIYGGSNDQDKPFKCDQCEASSVSEGALKQHRLKYHGRRTPVKKATRARKAAKKR